MYTCQALLRSTSPYGYNAFIAIPKEQGERENDHEIRVWRERCHITSDGFCFIPPMQFKRALESTARYRQDKIQGMGKRTLTQYFERAVVVPEALVLPTRKEDVLGKWVMVPTDGKTGSGKRVPKCFPYVEAWEGVIEIVVIDQTVKVEDVERTLVTAGIINGIGFWRPQNRGLWGKFEVEGVQVKEEEGHME